MSGSPLLHLKRESPRLHALSIKCLVDLLVDIEKKRAAGPWDDWDGVALDQCREVVRRRLDEAYAALDDVLEKDRATNLRGVRP